MSGEGYRRLKECRARSRYLRGKGFTYDQIVEFFALDHQVSPLRLFRYAHGRTAADIADDFNTRDAAGTASLRDSRLFDYEAWPETGRRPPAWTLAIFAAIYQTRARALITDEVYATYRPKDRDRIDRIDHRHDDLNRQPTPPRPRASMEPSREETPLLASRKRPVEHPPALTRRECEELFQAVCALEADVKRRNMLFQLALSLGGPPALALLRHLSPEESESLAHAIHTPGGVDSRSVATVEKLTAQCRRLDDSIGPQAVLPIVDANRDIVARLLRRESLSPGIRDRLVSAYAQLCQLAGYLHYDLTDYAGATDRFEEGLKAALDVGDATMSAYIHMWLSNMAAFKERPGEALDHAFAAQGWAHRSPSHLVRAITTGMQAWALALENRHGTPSEKRASTSLRLLQAARAEARRPTAADPTYLYWVAEEGALEGVDSYRCLNALGRTDETISAAVKQAICKPGYSRTRCFGLLYQAEALIAKREIPAATENITAAADLAGGHTSARLTVMLQQVRARLTPWASTSYVRELDDRLRGRTFMSGSGR